jgi:beta-glucosidase
VVTPVKQLKAFAKPFLRAGETQTVELRLPIQELALYDINMNRIVEEGDFELQAGGASDDIKLKKTVNVGGSHAVQPVPDDVKTPSQAYIAENPGKAIRVRGTLRDVQATPVAGASIKSIYSGKEVTSDKNGRYSVESVENDVLVISAKGFGTQNISVNKTKSIDVKLDYIHQ